MIGMAVCRNGTLLPGIYNLVWELICVWFGKLTVKYKAQIARLAKMSGKIMGLPPHYYMYLT